MITITITGIPPMEGMPAEVKAELFDRIGFACDWMPEQAEEANWPKEIKVWVETYTDTGPTEDGLGFFEMHHLYFPANGHGFHSSDVWSSVWFRVCASWDEESTSTIIRDHFGNLYHWM